MATKRGGDEILRRLHRGLGERRPPQDVAADLLELGVQEWVGAVTARDLYLIVRRARAYGETSSMPKTWRRHAGLARACLAAGTAVATVAERAGRDLPEAADPADPESLLAWLTWALDLLGLPADAPAEPRLTVPRAPKRVTTAWGTYHVRRRPNGARGEHGGHADARERMTAATRRELLPGVPVRAYRRAVRAVLHLQQRTTVLAAERDREAATAFGKSRLAHLITEEEFLACPRTAAFTAYYVSRLNLRTRFTNGSQARPMDTLAEELLGAALAAPTCRPWVLASVLTRWAVLDRLDDAQCGALLGRYYEQLAAAARALRSSFDANRDRTHMVVRGGDDSYTWNVASRAFNQARTGWLNVTRALGYDDLVERSCPGKVPALVASDVAAWHAADGGDQHADVRVWALLPLPWEVVLGDAECPADLVRERCLRAGVDPESTGWTQPYRQDVNELPAPAPDLVHGVVVASPLLATVMRRAGVFSGQAG
ncbi:hypothetical protein Acy02nite_73330 [Actinoplanes cyaneus]|uniref:Uncharacterized protein n=1 Tax=Actinoplanes cyaneus TaxID=52696 RepID=A0A919IS50_9ACTN|nr:hypothetical protein [Actinoplanes cyaneus]MCW2135549.1 hypothetical protein [Actinoplanes cyaneus]GID69452.1 hypothetical protein Acy02nite_73330 [Actinoplanes cyaneus]